MTNTVIQFRRTATPGNVPNPQMLQNGEFILNFADANLFFKAANGTVQRILGGAGGGPQNTFDTINANTTLVVAGSGGNSLIRFGSSNGVSIQSDTTTDTMWINLTATGVTANIYGDSWTGGVHSMNPRITIDAYGRATAASNGPDTDWQLARSNIAVNGTTNAISWFPNANITLDSSSTYKFHGLLLIRRAGATLNVSIGFSNGSVSLYNIAYSVGSWVIGSANTAATGQSYSYIETPLHRNVTVSSASVETVIKIDGWLTTNVGGTFRPEYRYRLAPTTPLWVMRGTYFYIKKINDGMPNTRGVWTT